MSGNDKRLDRRSILKTIGATAVAGVSLSGTVGATTSTEVERRRLASAYSDERRLRAAFQQHGADLRETLVDEGFVAKDFEFGSLDFEIDADETGLDPTDEDGVAGVTAVTKDETVTAFASVSTSSATHDLSLFVQPERDKAYALAEPKDGGDRVKVFGSGVSPSGCLREECTSDSCSTCYSVGETYDCDADCESNCTLIDTNCNCKSCSCDQQDYCTPECSYC